MVRELAGVGQVVEASDNDDLIVWAAQGMKPGVRAWAVGELEFSLGFSWMVTAGRR